MVNTYIFRITRPERYRDEDADVYQQRLVDLFICRSYRDVVMVEELGEGGDNLHWHGRITTDRGMSAVRKDFNEHFDLKGNEEFSLKSWDPAKADRYHRYLAKGPISQRLVMPRVIVDDIGLMWERLHHAFHDEKVATEARSRKGKVENKASFLTCFIARCREKGALNREQVFSCFREMFSRQIHQIDPFVADRLCWTAYCAVNPTDGFDSMRSQMRFFN